MHDDVVDDDDDGKNRKHNTSTHVVVQWAFSEIRNEANEIKNE